MEISVAFGRLRQRGHERLGRIRYGDLAVAHDFRRGNRMTIKFLVCLIVACNGGITDGRSSEDAAASACIDDDLRAQQPNLTFR